MEKAAAWKSRKSSGISHFSHSSGGGSVGSTQKQNS
jgi:hypothetical protein